VVPVPRPGLQINNNNKKSINKLETWKKSNLKPASEAESGHRDLVLAISSSPP
jgi:hypothetical protein